MSIQTGSSAPQTGAHAVIADAFVLPVNVHIAPEIASVMQHLPFLTAHQDRLQLQDLPHSALSQETTYWPSVLVSLSYLLYFCNSNFKLYTPKVLFIPFSANWQLASYPKKISPSRMESIIL